jgi:hypothetical protein
VNGRRLILAAAALAALTLASPVAAGNEAARIPLSIGTIIEGDLFGSGTVSGTFTLDLGPSADAGKLTMKYSYGIARKSARGQTFRPGERTETLKGKFGTLVIHSSGRQFRVGVENPKDPDGDSEVWTGTWSIVRGTGRYAALKGGGEIAGIVEISGHGLSLSYFHRYEGFATRS